LQRLPLRAHIRTYVYYCIMHTQVYKAPSLWPQNQRCAYIMRSITLHKTSCMYIDFWKWVVSKHGDSTEATRGWSTVPHAFQWDDQHVCLWYF
jgi:hypothetical protein